MPANGPGCSSWGEAAPSWALDCRTLEEKSSKGMACAQVLMHVSTR